MPSRLILSPFFIPFEQAIASCTHGRTRALAGVSASGSKITYARPIAIPTVTSLASGLLTIPFTDCLKAIGRNCGGTLKYEICFNGSIRAKLDCVEFPPCGAVLETLFVRFRPGTSVRGRGGA